MILVDTSVWIDFLQKGNDKLAALLEADQVVCHPFVIGELACGNLRNRRNVLSLLNGLRRTALATHEETLQLIEKHELMGRGLGYIDVHLLAATLLESPARLWTNDKRLRSVADSLRISYHL